MGGGVPVGAIPALIQDMEVHLPCIGTPTKRSIEACRMRSLQQIAGSILAMLQRVRA